MPMTDPGTSRTLPAGTDPEHGDGTGRLILAAGAVVWRSGQTGREYAIVHRPSYDDWVLPKGKLEEGERPLDAARREVWEETGVRGEPARMLGTVTYPVGHTTKVVFFWLIRATSEAKFSPGEEVDRIAWLPGAAAVKQLTYPSEAGVLMKVLEEEERPRRSFGTRAGGWRWVSGGWEVRRLAAAIESYRVDLERRIEEGVRGGGKPPGSRAMSALRLVAMAEAALGRRSLDEGWQFLLAAQRMAIYGLAPGELAAHAEALRHEIADKLGTSWRGTAAANALERGDGEAPDPDAVHLATFLRDEHLQNQYRKLALARRQLVTAGVATVAALLGIVFFSVLYPLTQVDPGFGSWEMFVHVILFGILGGAVSTAIPVRVRSKRSRVPQQLGASDVERTRPLLGGAAALGSYAILEAGILSVAGGGPAAILAVAFAAGFSERLVIRGVGAVVGAPDEPKLEEGVRTSA